MTDADQRDDSPEAHSYVRWPLQLARFSYGWTVTVYDAKGHVRHLASAESEVQALRVARRLVRVYHIQNDILVRTSKGNFVYPISKLHA